MVLEADLLAFGIELCRLRWAVLLQRPRPPLSACSPDEVAGVIVHPELEPGYFGSHNLYPLSFFTFAHLALAAFLALARRWAGVSASARARPPLAAPRRARPLISSRRACWISSLVGFRRTAMPGILPGSGTHRLASLGHAWYSLLPALGAGHRDGRSETMATILKARGRRRRCWCRGPRSGPLCDRCLDREARNRRAASEVFVRYMVWPELYVEDGEAGA